MAAFEVSIDATAVQAALAKLSPAAVDKRAAAAMNESVAYLQTEVRKGTPTGATALLGQSIAADINGTTFMGMQGRVFSPLDYAQWAEEGRLPGKMPPIGQPGDNTPLRLWARRVLGDEKLTFLIARSVARRGTKGVHMFRNAAQKGKGVVLRIWERRFRL